MGYRYTYDGRPHFGIHRCALTVTYTTDQQSILGINPLQV